MIGLNPSLVSIGLTMLLLALAGGLFAQDPDSDEKDSKEKIFADQQRLAEQYELLEKKLFSLYQYEQVQNPDRSELLQKAYQTSREKLTLEKLHTAVQQLGQSRFRNAEQSQESISSELQALLDLLQSEDRSKRVRNQIDRYKEYIKEINRILRIQQGIRGQNERGDNPEKLKHDQQGNADRTGNLDEKISSDQSDGQATDKLSKEKKPQDSPQSKDTPSNPPPSDQQGEDSQPDNGQPSEGSPQDGQSGESAKDQDGDRSPSESEDPVQNNLQRAEQRMREAHDKLDESKRDESIQKMRQAERELQQAKRELERILRQLREEEIKRTLASLENRFRRMLELQVKIHEDTTMLDAARQNSPVDETEIQSGKLAVREKGLVTEAARALLILEDDGSSIAVTEVLLQTQQDMHQVADRLSAAKTDRNTQEIQQSIIEALGFLVEVFEKAKSDQDQQQQQQGQKGQGQPPGDQALINQLAELKLIRGLQKQILNRHSRYSRLMSDPSDEIGHTDDPGIRQALEQLSKRQARLQQIAYDIVIGKNQ